MFAGLFAEIALVVSRMPVGYVNASVAIGILGFTLLPAGGVIEWFLPWEGRYTRLTRGLALFGTGVAILATIYWVYAIFSNPGSAFGDDFLTVGVSLPLATFLLYYLVSVLRARESKNGVLNRGFRWFVETQGSQRAESETQVLSIDEPTS